MVKHIDGNKIARAARNKAISHSYSGATVNQISAKFDDQTEKSQYDTTILHVGTNDLVHEEPEKVAADMDNLINKVKGHTNKVAVSGAIKRYDGTANNRKIDYYNKLLHDLCSKHKITYIDNSYIGKSLFNRSNLHLNRDGDKALGRAFCTYLKSNRIQNTNNHFFLTTSWSSEGMDNVPVHQSCQTHDETQTRVNNMSSKNMSSDFLGTLSSIPNERGFKMAFLNIVSLLKKIDEIKFSITNKFIDLIAFNETRLDPSITDNMISLDGYDVIRKDRSINGGGVCIYLRSSISYKI